MKTKTLLLACLLAITLTAAEPSKPAAFEVRLVLESASPDSEQLTLAQQRIKGKKTAEERLHVQKKPLLDRSALKSAAIQKNAVSGDSEIQVTFTEQGAKRFAEVTRDHVGQRLAMVIDGKVHAAPKVMMEITGGKAVISGSFSEQEATDLAARLSEFTPPGAYIPKEQLAHVGYATPEAALQTITWAMMKGTYDQVNEGLPPEDLASELKDPKGREGFEARQKIMAPLFKGLQILAKKVLGEDKAELKIKMDVDPIPNQKQQMPPFMIQPLVKVGDVWKLGGSTRGHQEAWDKDGQIQTYAP